MCFPLADSDRSGAVERIGRGRKKIGNAEHMDGGKHYELLPLRLLLNIIPSSLSAVKNDSKKHLREELLKVIIL